MTLETRVAGLEQSLAATQELVLAQADVLRQLGAVLMRVHTMGRVPESLTTDVLVLAHDCEHLPDPTRVGVDETA